MKRWLRRLLGVVAVCGMAVGCKQQMFLNKECFELSQEVLPARVESDYSVANNALTNPVPSPANLKDPDRPAWNLTLREAFALALENGSVGDLGGAGQGTVNDQFAQFSTGASFNAQTDRVKALALNPAIAGSSLEAALARFDAQWVTAMNWSTTDNLQQGLTSFQNGSNSSFSTSVVKPLATGGIATATFLNNYRFLSQPPAGGAFSVLNPFYESRLQFGLEQPLWRDSGVELNQILARFPTFLGTGASGATQAFNNRQVAANAVGIATEGILISRIRTDQQRAEFERRVQNLLLNVEVAYWKLYQAYGNLYSYEEVLRIAHKSWLTNQAKFIAGTIGPATYHPIRAQYEEFRGERIAALGLVLERERNLRGLMGLAMEDGRRIVPIDTPTLAPYQPNWDAAQEMAIAQKPELSLSRDNLRSAQFAVVQQKNYIRPDLRFAALYSPVGFGTTMQGDGILVDGTSTMRPSNSLRALASDHFNDWTLGLTLSMPLGFRLEHAAVRAARLQLAQSYYLLKDQEDRTTRVLGLHYQKLSEWYTLIEARRAERKAYAESVEARYREFAVGKTTVADFLLDAQRRLAAAQLKEYEAIAEYNNTLARFEWAKGNLLRHNNIVIAEGNVPECAEVRAVDHERERAKAIILRERPEPMQHPGRLALDNTLPEKLELNPAAAVVPAANKVTMPATVGMLPATEPGAAATMSLPPVSQSNVADTASSTVTLGPAPLAAAPATEAIPLPGVQTLPAIATPDRSNSAVGGAPRP